MAQNELWGLGCPYVTHRGPLIGFDPARAVKFVDIKQSLTTPELRDHCSAAGGNMEYDRHGRCLLLHELSRGAG
jgi:hypothetical protein